MAELISDPKNEKTNELSSIKKKHYFFCEMSKICLLSHLVPVAIFTILLALLSFVTTSCTSDQSAPLQYDASKNIDQAGSVANESTTQIAAHLSGTWECSKNSISCRLQTIHFSPDLSHVSIANYARFCLMQTEFDSAVQPEKDGVIYFSVSPLKPSELQGESRVKTSCRAVLNSTNGIQTWEQNYSLTHSDNWEQITIDEMTFDRVPAPSPSVSPSASPSSRPSDVPADWPTDLPVGSAL
jgi:hypothetical protein